MKVSFEGHKGTGDYDGRVNFYGMEFKSILDAVKYLKFLKPGDYSIWTYRRVTGLIDES